jgi:pimeloyl-ACP methyl ester carboxylesterase
MVFLAGTYRPFGDGSLDTRYETALEMVFTLLDRSANAAAMVRTTLLEALSGGRSPAVSSQDAGADVLARIDPALVAAVSAPYLDDESTLRYAKQIREFWSYSIEQDVRSIQAPVFVIGAELDRVASSRLGLRVAQAMPHACYAELPGATHYCMYDRPDDVASIVGRFIGDPLRQLSGDAEVRS